MKLQSPWLLRFFAPDDSRLCAFMDSTQELISFPGQVKVFPISIISVPVRPSGSSSVLQVIFRRTVRHKTQFKAYAWFLAIRRNQIFVIWLLVVGLGQDQGREHDSVQDARPTKSVGINSVFRILLASVSVEMVTSFSERIVNPACRYSHVCSSLTISR